MNIILLAAKVYAGLFLIGTAISLVIVLVLFWVMVVKGR